MITCDCEVYEICPSCAPSEPVYAKAAEWHDKVMRGVQADERRAALEHELATTFTTMQRERVPGKRQELWAECLRLAKELEKMDHV